MDGSVTVWDSFTRQSTTTHLGHLENLHLIHNESSPCISDEAAKKRSKKVRKTSTIAITAELQSQSVNRSSPKGKASSKVGV